MTRGERGNRKRESHEEERLPRGNPPSSAATSDSNIAFPTLVIPSAAEGSPSSHSRVRQPKTPAPATTFPWREPFLANNPPSWKRWLRTGPAPASSPPAHARPAKPCYSLTAVFRPIEPCLLPDLTLFDAVSLFAAVALAAWLAGFALRRVLVTTGVMDHPRAYSSHERPVPRGGGLLVVIAFFGWYFFGDHGAHPGLDFLAIGVAAVAIVSFLDDIRSRSRRLRFVVYTVAAAAFVWQLFRIDVVTAWGPAWLVAFLLWLWVAGYANAFNFIDGIDGLAATQAIGALGFGAAFCAMAPDAPGTGDLVALQLVLAAAMTGFLAHNLPRARLFLGDVGSIATGFLMAAIAVMAAIEIDPATGLCLAALHLGPVLDTGLTLARRLWQRKNPADRHREFFFHRAIRSGLSHLQVTAAELAIQGAGASLILLVRMRTDGMEALATAIAAIAVGWLVYFGWCERRFHRLANGERKDHA